MTRRIRTAALAVAATLLVAATLAAHAKVTKTLPAADETVTAKPTVVQVWFSEAPDAKVSKLTLEGPSGAVKLGTVAAGAGNSIAAPIEGPLADGKYTVNWQTAGKDGHVQKGAFAFTVRQTR
jgi:methionine-rich copper-binding protein CopC